MMSPPHESSQVCGRERASQRSLTVAMVPEPAQTRDFEPEPVADPE